VTFWIILKQNSFWTLIRDPRCSWFWRNPPFV